MLAAYKHLCILTIDWRPELMTNRSEHDLHVLLHHKLSLELFLSRNIREDENYLPLCAPVVRLDPHIIVDSVDILTFWSLIYRVQLSLATLS